MWIAGFFLFFSSVYYFYQKKYSSTLMLVSTIVLATSLVVDRVFPLFEPIYFGWFSEIAGAVSIFIIGLIMAKEVVKQYRNRLQLEIEVAFANRQLHLQENQYKSLLESSANTRALRHDLRHHLITISHLASEDKIQNIKSYIEELVQEVSQSQQKIYCKNPAVNAIVSHYLSLAVEQKVLVEARLELGEDMESTLTMDLCILLGNLLENAVEACQEVKEDSKFIRILSKETENTLSFIIENSFNGAFYEEHGYYHSRKKQWKEKGVGLASVNAICNKYNGFPSYETTKDTWTVSLLLTLPRKETENSLPFP
ncbi:MAG: GHKL domain-containing protein [Clostridiales bacterium]|nr:GHKL domain-containing protein [Clostridiales bacterium]